MNENAPAQKGEDFHDDETPPAAITATAVITVRGDTGIGMLVVFVDTLQDLCRYYGMTLMCVGCGWW